MASDQRYQEPVASESHTLKTRSRKERVRVTRACDRCRKRKIKCNGTQPCGFCLRAKACCTFVKAYARGRIPCIPASGDRRSPRAVDQEPVSENTLEYQQYSALLPKVVAAPGAPELHGDHISPLDVAPSTFDYDDSQSSPSPSQTDLQGNYIGPASGVSFLLRIQKRLHKAISSSQANSIFAFGDAPMPRPEFDPSFCMMLPKDDAQRLVDRYFDFAMPTYRFLHKPTLQQWFNEFYDTLGAMHDQQNASARIALLFMVFAHARVYMTEGDQPGPSDLSNRYFIAADHQLSKEKGSIRLTSVQARLLQCYYLLTQSRINHCWSLFGTVSHLALAIGLNRKDPSDFATGLNVVDAECRRRTFWCAYTLDAYLSAALGRPRTFHDNDIDAELPACVEDEDLVAGQVTIPSPPGSSRRPSTMLAALAHMKLAQITSKILSNLYSVKPISAALQVAAVKEISQELSDWRTELSRFLDVDTVSTSLFLPIFQRQRNVLNMTYWHAIILTHRPYVLSSSSRLSQSAEQNEHEIQQNESLRKCLDAAMMTANTISEITESRQLYRAFWNTAYFAFGATIMLYIYVIQECASPPEVYSRYLTAASRCQSHISAIAEKGSLSERYSLVLEELRVEALRQTKRANTCRTGLAESSRQLEDEAEPMFMHMNAGQVGVPAATNLEDNVMDLNGNLPGLYPDYSGWGQFTSLVSSGLGNMDMFMNCDSFNF